MMSPILFRRLVATAALVLAAITPQHASAYQFWSEGPYVSNFDQLEAATYSSVDDAGVAPADLLSACKTDLSTANVVAGGLLDGSEVVLEADDDGDPNFVRTVSAASAQAQCGTSSVCVVPRGMRLVMDSNLNVAALRVRGELLWRDEDQPTADQYLCGGYVAVEGPAGRFVMRLTSDDKRGWIYIKDNGATHPHGKSRFFGGVGDTSGNVYDFNQIGPNVEIMGRQMKRTWSLLAQGFKAGQLTMKLLHSPLRMGWKIGDRIGVAPTQKGSDGTGHTFTITAMGDDGTVTVDQAFRESQHDRSATFVGASQSLDEMETRSAALMSAEVVNLSRNVVITGDDFRHIPCDDNAPHACRCSEHKTQCTMGLHTAQMHYGTMSIRNTRVEKCGQRGVTGKYCLHFHRLSDCPTCEFSNNAIEHGHHRGIIVHGTHNSLVENNVIWGTRGAGVYVEDGNEMHNRIQYNVIVCPWPLGDPVLVGCTIPGTDNAEADTPLNHAGIYTETSANDFIGNRVSNSFNGMLLQASGNGKGAAYGRVCTSHLSFGRWEGNTFHGHSRFGLYTLSGSKPRTTDQSVENDGFNTNQGSCSALTNDGSDRGAPVAILNNVDWGTVFVGHYNAGDMQHRGHFSWNNNNLMYWKETKNFADGCGAHISESYYAHGNMALPDQSTFIMERTTFDAYVVLEANHHCNVGVTGMLCMPQYIFHDVKWKVSKGGAWIWLQRGGTGGGGVFSLSPPNAQEVLSATPEEQAAFKDMVFPPGYVSLASGHYTYLEAVDLCVKSGSLGLNDRYTGGILCKAPLRVLKVWSTDLNSDTAPSLKVEVWLNNTLPGTFEQGSRPPDASQMVNFHAIANLGGGKQGYSLPVFPLDTVSYRLSLGDEESPIPGNWIIEFSDPVMGNRWGEEFVNLNVKGRICEDGGVISSQHSRRYLFGLGIDVAAWGNSGACVESLPPKMPAIDCTAAAVGKAGTVAAGDCPGLCTPTCNSNSFCHCGSATCICKPGFSGSDCSIDICATGRCGEHGSCAARYLGSDLPVANLACICDKGWKGPFCDQKVPTNIARQGVATQSSTCWGGEASRAIDGNTNQQWGGNSISHTCDAGWWQVELQSEQAVSYVIIYNRLDCCSDRLNDAELQVLDGSGIVIANQTIVNGISQNHIYFDGVVGKYVRIQKKPGAGNDLNIAEVQVFGESSGCSACTVDNECQVKPRCNSDGSCPTGPSPFMPDDTPCHTKPMGTCQEGQCIEAETPTPTLEPSGDPITLSPTQLMLSTRENLVFVSTVSTASQSSTCHGGNAGRAIDGNTNGNWYSNSVQHTCLEANPWWTVDLGKEYDYTISRVLIYNRNDCCMDRLGSSNVEVLDDDRNVIARQLLPAGSSNPVYYVDFGYVDGGRFVRVYKTVYGDLNIAEVQVLGWAASKSPTISPSLSPTPKPTSNPSLEPSLSLAPTPAITTEPTASPLSFDLVDRKNLALSPLAKASQSSTCHGGYAAKAIDGNTAGNYYGGSVQHTCNDATPWFMVDLGEFNEFIINEVYIYSRTDCCIGIGDANIEVLAEDGSTVVATQSAGPASVVNKFTFDNVSGRYVRVIKNGGAFTIAELMVFGWSLHPDVVNLARLPGTVPSQSSLCWNGGPARAVDGNTNGNWGGNSIQHTCGENNPWWKVELAPGDYVIKGVEVYNRWDDCCRDRNTNSDVQILDASGNVIASQSIANEISAVYKFSFDDVEEGRYVRVMKNGSGTLNLAEVKVIGFSKPTTTNTASAHYAADGCVGNGIFRHTTQLADDSLSNVSCCSGSADEGNLVCTRPGCKNLNFQSAKAHCESQGLRLCTVAEFFAGACCGKGCSYDNELNWASDVVTSSTIYVRS